VDDQDDDELPRERVVIFEDVGSDEAAEHDLLVEIHDGQDVEPAAEDPDILADTDDMIVASAMKDNGIARSTDVEVDLAPQKTPTAPAKSAPVKSVRRTFADLRHLPKNVAPVRTRKEKQILHSLRRDVGSIDANGVARITRLFNDIAMQSDQNTMPLKSTKHVLDYFTRSDRQKQGKAAMRVVPYMPPKILPTPAIPFPPYPIFPYQAMPGMYFAAPMLMNAHAAALPSASPSSARPPTNRGGNRSKKEKDKSNNKRVQ
jgi:hypothetical protein